MKINLGQGNGVRLTKWRMWALKHWTGAEARVAFASFAARLKSYPVTKPIHAVPFRAWLDIHLLQLINSKAPNRPGRSTINLCSLKPNAICSTWCWFRRAIPSTSERRRAPWPTSALSALGGCAFPAHLARGRSAVGAPELFANAMEFATLADAVSGCAQNQGAA